MNVDAFHCMFQGVSSNDMDGSGDKQSTLTGLSSQKSSEVDNGGSGDDDDDDRSSIESTSHTELGTLFNEPGTQVRTLAHYFMVIF